MSTNVPPPLGAPVPTPPPKKSRMLLYGCGAVLALFLIIVATVAITLWWIQRPIKPVVLSPKEKAVVEQKLRVLDQANTPAPSADRVLNRDPKTGKLPESWLADTRTNQGLEHIYIPGSKSIRITEREINGLLNSNTDLGHTVRLEFDRDAVNAYLAVPIPKDFPIGGGRMFRARGRFRISIGNGGTPFAVLEDVTVFGVSLPKAWLGGIKGENLLADAMHNGGGPVIRGIKSLRVEPGALVLDLED